jgi:hypothetical protein
MQCIDILPQQECFLRLKLHEEGSILLQRPTGAKQSDTPRPVQMIAAYHTAPGQAHSLMADTCLPQKQAATLERGAMRTHFVQVSARIQSRRYALF